MKTSEKLCLTIGLAVLTAAAGASQEQRVKMADLPAAVRATVKAQSVGAKIRGFSKEVENGKTLYEAEMTVNGHGKDIEMDSTGAVVEVEEEVNFGSIPEAARSAIKKGAAGGKVLKVESVTHGTTLVAYEAAVSKAGKHSEVRVDPEGKPAPESD